MFTRLRQPGGVVGGLSLAAALFLGLLGILGAVSLLIAAASGADFWSDQRADQLVSAALFAVVAAGAVGFVIMDHRPWLGAAIAVVGSLLMGFLLWWAFLPLVLSLVFAVVAVVRARLFAARIAAAPGQATV
jgi:hypothetical protein